MQWLNPPKRNFGLPFPRGTGSPFCMEMLVFYVNALKIDSILRKAKKIMLQRPVFEHIPTPAFKSRQGF